MSIPTKYEKYNKGRFVKPRSRKEKSRENKVLEDRKSTARRNIIKWIDALPNAAEMSIIDDTNYNEDNGSGNDDSGSLIDVEEILAVGEESGNTLNKGFVEGATNFKHSTEYTESPVKCDVSVENLLPRRLRERIKSDNNIKDSHQPSEIAQNLEISYHLTQAQTQTTGTAGVTQNCNQYNLKDVFVYSAVANMDREVQFKCPSPLDQSSFEKSSQQEKMGSILSTLNNLCLKLEEVDTQVNHDSDGVISKITSAQTQLDGSTKEINIIVKENKILKGLVQRQFCQIRELNDRVAILSAKSMENTLTISGIEGDTNKEDACEKIIQFFKNQVEVDAEKSEIFVAHRIGKFHKNLKKPRLMKVRCVASLRERVMSNVSNLAEKTNEAGDSYYINKQLPEKIAEQNRENRFTIKELKSKESSLPLKDRSKIEIKDKIVYQNGEPLAKELLPPEPLDLFPEGAERDKLDKMKLSSSDAISEKGSDFQAYAIKTGQMVEVRRAYRKVKALHPAATHIIGTYNLKAKSGFQDDGEYSAGFKLLKAIQENNSVNVAVFVIRNYGGFKLGPKRHELIKQVGLQAVSRIGK